MGTEISLGVGNFEVDWSKSYAFNLYGELFQETDRKDVVAYYPDPDDESPDAPMLSGNEEALQKPLGQVLDRLALIGHSLEITQALYEREFERSGHRHELTFDELKSAVSGADLSKVSRNTRHDYEPGQFVKLEILKRLAPATGLRTADNRSGTWELDLLLEGLGPYSIMQMLGQRLENHCHPVTWYYCAHRAAGWSDDDDIRAGVGANRRFLVVTEGSTDASIIKKAIKVLRPHLSDFFAFVDVDKGYPFTGEGNLVQFVRGLSALGVSNRIIAVFDNDVAGRVGYDKLVAAQLPCNIAPVLLPDLDAHREVCTIGPSGETIEDIRGRAASIELYLDLASVTRFKPQVRWTSFNKQAGAYQGELRAKDLYTKVFLDNKTVQSGYDFSGLEQVVRVLFETAAVMAECVYARSDCRFRHWPENK